MRTILHIRASTLANTSFALTRISACDGPFGPIRAVISPVDCSSASVGLYRKRDEKISR